MEPNLWGPAKALFHELMDLDGDSRTARLRVEPDQHLASEVRRLLDNAERAGEKFLAPPPEVSAIRAVAEGGALPPGTLVAGRYRIMHAIAAGGMGAVYAASDLLLNQSVALKVLSSALANDSVQLERFRREVQVARRISHPNICRIHDLGVDTTRTPALYCLTMELINGETLRDLIQQGGQLEAAEIRRIAMSMLDGLAAAHRAEVVHRDLKPGNVMLETGVSRRVVLMDFGIALQSGGAHTLTNAGGLMGTAAYMAPERFHGVETPQSDLYSAGLILEEMWLSGGRARAAIPDEWKRLIASCLERDPARRPDGATALADAMARIGEQSAGRPRITRRSAILAVCASAASLGWLLSRRSGGGAASAPPHLVVAGISNQTGDPRFNAIASLLRTQMAQSAYVDILAEARAESILSQMQRPASASLDPATARQVALRGGCSLVLYGVLSALGPDLVLNLKVERVGSNPFSTTHAWQSAFNAGGPDDLRVQLQRAANWVRQIAGESSQQIAEHDQPPADLSTPSWEAFQLYQTALQRRAQDRPADAELLLRQAIELDPDFATALQLLADLLVSQHRYAEGFTVWAQALSKARVRHLQSRERFRMESMYWDDANDWGKAEGSYATWAAQYPRDFVPVFYRAAMVDLQGRTDEAIGLYKRSLALEEYHGTHEALGVIHMTRGEWPDVERSVDALARLTQPQVASYLRARLLLVRGMGDEALRELGRLQSAGGRWGERARLLECNMVAEAGELARAAAMLEDLLRAGKGDNASGWAAQMELGLGSLLWRLGNVGAAISAAQRAEALEPGPSCLPRAAQLLSLCGQEAAIAAMERRTRDWPKLPIFLLARLRIRGELELARNEAETAVGWFRQAVLLESPIRMRDYLALALSRCGVEPEARQRWREVASSTGTIWRKPERVWPGLAHFAATVIDGSSPIPELARH